jgi:hypothetical protein
VRIAGAHSYRVGRTLGCTLYAQLTPEPGKTDVFLALFNTRELATLAADRLNDPERRDLRWIAIGRLIYPLNTRLLPDDFLAVAVTADVATMIVSAVSGDG